MPSLAVIGAQWGDEGKGKVVDLLSESFDVVARFQGGPNAGHTVTIGGVRHALHHIPAGVFRPGVTIVIGNGMVLDLEKLQEEIEALERAGLQLAGRLFISDRAHVILPLMRQLDQWAESQSHAGIKLGTTLRGIGPTYEAKAARVGVRVADLFEARTLLPALERLLASPLACGLRAAGEDPGEPAALAREIQRRAARIAPYVTDTVSLLNERLDRGDEILFEGAQGSLLDIDHGFYPYVTSSTTLAGGLCGGLGISPKRVDAVLGVFKAYCTRVGSGPMPTELADGPHGHGERLRRRGREYGTTTGRPRRCGWFDGVAAAYAQRLNRFDCACVTLLDVLDGFEEVRVCVAYRLDGQELRVPPPTAATAERVEPVYETLPGWRGPIGHLRRWEELPREARAYLDRLAELIGTEVDMVSVGPDRAQSILRSGSWLARRLGRDVKA